MHEFVADDIERAGIARAVDGGMSCRTAETLLRAPMRRRVRTKPHVRYDGAAVLAVLAIVKALAPEHREEEVAHGTAVVIGADGIGAERLFTRARLFIDGDLVGRYRAPAEVDDPAYGE